MIIPLSTDAPVYHFPVATIGLIVVNVVCFLISGMGSEEMVERWAMYSLQHGQGLHPVQWVTSNFLHAGFMHLIGNMIFFWGFGLVVEGKLGWWKMLLVYLGIGITQCAIEQVLMLGADPMASVHQSLGFEFDEEELRDSGMPEDKIAALRDQWQQIGSEIDRQQIPGSLGASSIVYGMLAMSLVWAPKNEVNCLLMLGMRPITFEITIMSFALWYIGEEILMTTMQGFSMTTPLLHLMGAGLGFAVGVALFKARMVDCEDWDLFSVLSGHYGPYARDSYGNPIPRPNQQPSIEIIEVQKSKAKKPGPNLTQRKKAFESIAQLVEDGDFDTANDELYNLRLRDEKAVLAADVLEQLAIGLAKAEQWDAAVPLMEESIEHYPESADGMRFKLAQAQLKGLSDPRAALQTLKAIQSGTLSEDRRQQLQKLMKQAKSMLSGE